MDTRQTIWDPIRKKNVALTPEERVRQWCIGILADHYQVPVHMMMSEAGFKLGEKQYRADILVYDRKMKPLVVVECKRPEVDLTREVLDQAVRYNMVLNVRYMIITNGLKTLILKRNEEDGRVSYAPSGSMPVYNDMVI
ncbi:MAG: type I restriction enzyme HsdR N-terminal domain-containing protein [Bacteroidales bacterium]|nr:type I restriction enzyme HsdR N-terminal domain-containing protein [Bacteroidales bacterium]